MLYNEKTLIISKHFFNIDFISLQEPRILAFIKTVKELNISKLLLGILLLSSARAEL